MGAAFARGRPPVSLPDIFLPEIGLSGFCVSDGQPIFCFALIRPTVTGPTVTGPGLTGPGLTGPGGFCCDRQKPAIGGFMHTIIKIAVIVVMLVFIVMGVNTVFL